MKKGSCELPWIIHISRAFELQFEGDDLVRALTVVLEAPMDILKLCKFRVNEIVKFFRKNFTMSEVHPIQIPSMN